MLVIICGLPGTGKTFIAKKLAPKINAEHLSTDRIRKELFPEPSYSEEEKNKVYVELFSRAANMLSQKKNVILDATFFKNLLRQQAYKIAEENNSACYIIECITPQTKAMERLKHREKTGNSESDANVCVYKNLSEEFEPIEETHLVLDTSLPLAKQFAMLDNFLVGD